MISEVMEISELIEHLSTDPTSLLLIDIRQRWKQMPAGHLWLSRSRELTAQDIPNEIQMSLTDIDDFPLSGMDLWPPLVVLIDETDGARVQELTADTRRLLKSIGLHETVRCHYLSGGFSRVEREYPGLLTINPRFPVEQLRLTMQNQLLLVKASFKSTKPTEILENQLYLSGEREALLHSHQFDVVIRLMMTRTGNGDGKAAYNDSTNYCFLVCDSHLQPLAEIYEQTNLIIDKALSNGKRVLVHCAQGISRSASIILAYLMTKRQMSLKEAYLYVFQLRPIIRPNPGFHNQLRQLESESATSSNCFNSKRIALINCVPSILVRSLMFQQQASNVEVLNSVLH